MPITTDAIIPGGNPEEHSEHRRTFENYRNTHGFEFAEAYATYRRSLAEALKFADPNFTNSAVTRRRIELIENARTALAARGPAHQSIPGNFDNTPPTPGARQKLLASLQPTNADQVAVQGREWDMTRQLLGMGRTIEQVVAGASVQRLVAIAANAELLPEVSQSINPEAHLDYIHEMVVDRLASLGHAGARGIAAAEARDQVEAVWRKLIAEALEGAVSINTVSDLYQVDPEAATAISDADDHFIDGFVLDEEVARLDRVAKAQRN